MSYITGDTIRSLREKKSMTQKELATQLNVSEKTISKWETNKGLPDISIVPELARSLSVSICELLTGEVAENRNVSANMLKSNFYVCPICQNVVHAMGNGAFSCCGVRLPALEEENANDVELTSAHEIAVENIEDDLYVTVKHPMAKDHYISFLAYVTYNQVQICKLYPEGEAETRFRRAGRGKIFAYCNRHGLYTKTI